MRFFTRPARLHEAKGQIDLDNPTNRSILQQDFEYLQKTYWNDPRYLTINGRPVVILYLTRLFKGDGERTFQELRSLLKTNGHSIFLIGDEVYWREYHTPDPDRLRWFDAVTAYNMHASVPDIASQFTEKVRAEYSHWQDQARRVGVVFVPGVIPGFDDKAVRPNENHPPIPRNPNLFARQLEMAFDLTDPQLGLLMITSWNEWHEDTEIEPAQSFQFEYLTRLRAKLAERK